MIEGLVFEFKSAELKAHFLKREKYHDGRAKFYDKQGGALERGGLTSTQTSIDPIGSLRKSSKEHRRQAEYFALLGKHIIPGEVYRLGESDLGRAELVSSLY